MNTLPYRHRKRREEIAYFLAQGLTAWEIAQQLSKPEKVVKWHITAIKKIIANMPDVRAE